MKFREILSLLILVLLCSNIKAQNFENKGINQFVIKYEGEEFGAGQIVYYSFTRFDREKD